MSSIQCSGRTSLERKGISLCFCKPHRSTNTRLLAHFTHKSVLTHDHGTFKAVGWNEPLQTFVPSAIKWYGVRLEQNISTENCITVSSVICFRLTAWIHSRRPGKPTVYYEYKGMENLVTPFSPQCPRNLEFYNALCWRREFLYRTQVLELTQLTHLKAHYESLQVQLCLLIKTILTTDELRGVIQVDVLHMCWLLQTHRLQLHNLKAHNTHFSFCITQKP